MVLSLFRSSDFVFTLLKPVAIFNTGIMRKTSCTDKMGTLSYIKLLKPTVSFFKVGDNENC